MNQMTIDGIVSNIKKFDNDDGSVKLIFALSTRTVDPSRSEDKKARDFWNIEMFIPTNRTKVIEYITNGKFVQVVGIPYKRKVEDKEYVNIRASIDMLELRGHVNDKKDDKPASDQAQEETAGEPDKNDWEQK